MDCVEDIVLVLDDRLRIVMVNRCATAFFGYSANDLGKQPLSVLLEESEWPRMLELARDLKERRGGEAIFLLHSRAKAILRFVLSPIADNRLRRYLMIGKTVRGVDSELHDASHGLIGRMLNGFSDPLFVVDGASRTVRDCNEAALTGFGLAREEIVGRRLLDFAASEEERSRNDAVMARADATYAKAGIFQDRILFSRRSLPALVCDLIGIPILGRDGCLDSIIVILFDRTSEEEQKGNLASLIGRINTLAAELVAAAADYSTCGGMQRLSTLGFTARQIEIARLVASGLASKEIGARLGIAESTVKNHLAVIFRKLGVKTRASFTSKLFEQHIRID